VTSDQADRLAAREFDWLIICDAGRPDVFEEMYEEYVSGYYSRVHNGGPRNTPEWFAHHFEGSYDAMLFHGGQPIRSINAGEYDAREHFASVPYTTLYESNHLDVCPPDGVNAVVRQHLPDRLEVADQLHALGYKPRTMDDEFDFRIVRYLQPHKPYRELPETRGDAHPHHKQPDIVRAAYRDNYHWVLESVASLVAELPGTVVVTSDHGECLGDCGQWFHGPGNDPHQHLVEVPWLVVD
jgi:arylsulfatase A-like enzyme